MPATWESYPSLSWYLSAGLTRKWPPPQPPDTPPQDPVPHARERGRIYPPPHSRMSGGGKTGRLAGRKRLRLLVRASPSVGTRGRTDPDDSAAAKSKGELHPPVSSGVVRNPPQGKGEGPVASCCRKVRQEAHSQGILLTADRITLTKCLVDQINDYCLGTIGILQVK